MTIEWIRKFAPGYIGGNKIARRATDHEIGALYGFNDEIADHQNAIDELTTMVKNLQKSILSRGGEK